MKRNIGIAPAPVPAARQRPPRGRAVPRPAVLAARAARSSTTATRSAWATTSTSATATACARRCSGRPTATAASRRADFAQLYLPPLMDPVYGFQAVNVEAQAAQPELVPALGAADARRAAAAPGVRHRHASRCSTSRTRRCSPYLRRRHSTDGEPDDIVLCVNNLSRFAQPVELLLAELAGMVPIELHRSGAVPAHRRAALLRHPPPVRLLLVRAAVAPRGDRVVRPAP